jgi:hypothetical protein
MLWMRPSPMTAWTVLCVMGGDVCVMEAVVASMTAWTALCVPLWRRPSVMIAWACALVSGRRRRPPYVMEASAVHDCVDGAI